MIAQMHKLKIEGDIISGRCYLFVVRNMLSLVSSMSVAVFTIYIMTLPLYHIMAWSVLADLLNYAKRCKILDQVSSIFFIIFVVVLFSSIFEYLKECSRRMRKSRKPPSKKMKRFRQNNGRYAIHHSF